MTSFDHVITSEYSVSPRPETEISLFLIIIRHSGHTRSSVYSTGQQSMNCGSQKGKKFWTTLKMWSF